MPASQASSNHSAPQSFTPSSLATVIAIAVVAYAADDTVHELIGHGLASLMLHVKMLSISTIGLQTVESSRIVAAAGAGANVIAGATALLFAGRLQGFNSWRYFLWLFGFINLMNGTGYLMASALLGGGDWTVVIAGLNPPMLWRVGMGLTGVVLFTAVVRWAASVMARMIRQGAVNRHDLSRLTLPAYLAGGVLFVAASVFNPVGPSLILGSGAGASLGLTFGLLLVPRILEDKTEQQSPPGPSLQFSWSWLLAAIFVAAIFIGVFGPGVRLS
jgi:hypothetical protein